jgi:hypothetical protein
VQTSQYGDDQTEIHLDALSRKLPKYPVDCRSLPPAASEALARWAFSYAAGGAGGVRRAGARGV